MLIPQAEKTTQPQKSHTEAARTTAALAELVPHPPAHEEALVARLNPEGPAACCPTCGRPYAPFSLRASGVLDTLHLATDVLRDAIALVEEGAVP